MNTAQPIRSQKDLENLKNYYRTEEYHPRNAALLIVSLNTALRISDILLLQWGDVYDEKTGGFRSHISLIEQKTKKKSCIYMNKNICDALHVYRQTLEKEGEILSQRYLFEGKDDAPISRVQAYRIIRKAADNCHISGVISPHSLRKTFGYHAWKNGVSPALLMDIYNHSSFRITQRYLGIEQDDRDEVFKNIRL